MTISTGRRRLLFGPSFSPIVRVEAQQPREESFIITRSESKKPRDARPWPNPNSYPFRGTLEDALQIFVFAGAITERQADDFLIAVHTKGPDDRMGIKDGDHFYMTSTVGDADKAEYLEARVRDWDIQTSREAIVYRIFGYPYWLVQAVACHNWAIYYPPVWLPWSACPPTVMGPAPYTIYREGPPDSTGFLPQTLVPSNETILERRRAENDHTPPTIIGHKPIKTEMIKTPEPSALALFGVGLASLVWLRRRRRSST